MLTFDFRLFANALNSCSTVIGRKTSDLAEESLTEPKLSNVLDLDILRSQASKSSPTMKRVSQLPFSDPSKAVRSLPSLGRPSVFSQRCLHSSPKNPATVAPITASGPVPAAPVPSAEHVDSRVARRRKQAELLKRGQDLRAVAAGSGGGTAKTKRFWKHVHVKNVGGMHPISSYFFLHFVFSSLCVG